MPQVRSEAATGRFDFDLTLPVQRIGLPDFNGSTWHLWLMVRLGERWPHIGSNNFRSHAVTWINSNEHRFMRCGRATALAVRWMEPIAAKPIVREVFLFLEDKASPLWRREALRLYREMQMWAADLGAARVKIGEVSDVTPGRLAEMVDPEQETAMWLPPRRNDATTNASA